MRQVSSAQIQRKLFFLNPHWRDTGLDTLYPKKRKYFYQFYEQVVQFSIQRAVVLMGSRRVGKTVLLLQTISTLTNKGYDPKKLVYIPLDDPIFHDSSLEELLEYYQSYNDVKLKGCVILFDEIQYAKNWDNQLKVLVDQYPDTKFIASGSAASALKRKSTESGAGRFTDFILPPLTFYEYLDLLDLVDEYIEFDESNKKGIAVKNIDALNEEFINYINYGGFPEAVFNKAIRSNTGQFIQQDIVDKVLLRDLPSLYGIQDIQELNRLFQHLCYQTGQEISYEHLKSYGGITDKSIKKYIEYLESAFLIKRIYRIDENAKTFKTVRTFKVYLTNTSMYSALYGGSATEDETKTLGPLVETAIYSQYIHDEEWLRYLYYVKFKRSSANKDLEVDMVHLDKRFKPDWCLEIKWSDRCYKHPETLVGLVKFAKKNKPANIISCTTKTITGKKNIKGLDINFKPAALVCFNIGYSLINKGIY
jgi:predicted AAA+ superfamily ATPase